MSGERSMDLAEPSFHPDAWRIPRRSYRHVFLVQNRATWSACPYPYDQTTDLVLTFDFGLLREIRQAGGEAAYLDHLLQTEAMEPHNADVHQFLTTWFHDREGTDVFSYRGVSVGNALRLDVWNTVSYSARLLLNLQAVAQIPHQRLLVGLGDPVALDLLARLGLKQESWPLSTREGPPDYFFPIARWMNERIRPRAGLKTRLKIFCSSILDAVLGGIDRWGLRRRAGANVYVQRYFPTEPVVNQLKREGRVNVVLDHYTWRRGLLKEKRVPVHDPSDRHRRAAQDLLATWSVRRGNAWVLHGFSLSEFLYGALTPIAETVLPLALSTIDDILSSLAVGPPMRAMVHVSNLGLANGLLLDYCHKRQIPTYLLLNGLLLHKFPEEDITETTAINSYGESIKRDYFGGDPRVVCLGDPRLDGYVRQRSTKVINRTCPTVLIGTSGFSNIDLNSFSAVEFEFLHDLLTAFRVARSRGRDFRIELKVRTNGYMAQYRAFVAEYFQDLPISLCRSASFRRALETADFYISTYSGTHFEAACRGVPSLYYKNDAEILIPPYDGASELVTARTVEEAVDRIERFYNGDRLYEVFQDRRVLEKYVGPLDGKNTQRNVDFIYALTEKLPAAPVDPRG